MTYPLGDMLIRIKNASRAGHRSLEVPSSSLVQRVAQFLAKEDYLEGVSVDQDKRKLKIELKYEGKRPIISDLRQFSKPGLRRFVKVRDLAKLGKSGASLVILSTPEGLMSLKEARKKKLGGELLCEVW